jgi:3'-phosphoadenosine 5'-phosphosulfate sulfotransferase (PAPS reductase)/FAD synthetase
VRHIVALSGGKDSTAMALRLAELEPRDYEYVITPTGNELPEMMEHWRRLGKRLGSPLQPIGLRSLQGEIRRQNCLPNHRMRWCTRILKIEPFQAFLAAAAPAVSYVGIRADEADREGVDHSQIEGVELRCPLIEWGWGLARVQSYLQERGVVIPERTDCAMCFYQRLGEWWRLWKYHPAEYAEAATLERLIGHTLRSDARDTWPAALEDLAAEFERGRVPAKADQPMFWSTLNRSAMCAVCAR